MTGVIHPEADQVFLRGQTDESRLLAPFLDAGFDVTWARKIRLYNSLLSLFFLKPDSALRETYGFEYEILLVYSPYMSLEPRTFQAINRFMNGDPARGRVESMMCFLVSKARDVIQWTNSYMLEHREERIAIPIAFDELVSNNSNGWTVKNALQRHYLALDRYKYTLPLQEDTYFFGRDHELAKLIEALKRGENCGLFGLRKTGKTSLLFKLKRVMESNRNCLVHYIDAQSTSIRLRSWDSLLRYITKAISKSVDLEYSYKFDPEDAADDFESSIKAVLSHRSLKQIVLVVDEVEWISPTTCHDRHWNDEFSNFWHPIRAYQSKNRNLNVIIAGVNPSMVESDSFFGFQNPLFGIVTPVFISGLAHNETDEMIMKIGKTMGLRFTSEALSYLFDQYGGHPLLTRLACSFINDLAKSKQKTFPIQVTDSILKKEASIRDRELVFYCRHIVSELAQFYAEEYSLLETLATGDYYGFLQAAKKETKALHLYKYGIVSSPETPYITYAVVKDYIALENARKEGRNTRYRIVANMERMEFLRLRMHAIVEDLRTLESLTRRNNLPSLFGANSFPEADRLFEVRPPEDTISLSAALTTLHRSFVESIDNYGSSIRKSDYFWSTIKANYPALHDALSRIRVYRINAQHLELTTRTIKSLREFLDRDLEGDLIHVEDKCWVLFQICLDELHRALQREISMIQG